MRPISDPQKGIDFGAFQSLRQSVIGTDLDGKVFLWSDGAERMFGWRREYAVGRNVIDVTTQRQSREQALAILQDLSRGKIWAGEFRVADSQGRSFAIGVVDFPVRNAAGELVAILGVSERLDIATDDGLHPFADEEMQRLRRLTSRQVQVLRLMGRGMTNDEIAESLSLSPNTVKVHITRIIERLHATSRTKAALIGSRLAL